MNKIPVIFMGSPQVAVTILEALLQAGYEVRAVVTQPDKPAGRGQNLSPPPVKVFAEQHKLQILQPLKVKTPEFVEELKKFGAQALIVAAYGRILSQEILDLTPHPLNVHFSLLPKYRGASCVASALLNDEAETGVTIMKVVEALDAGPILSQEKIQIQDEDSTGSLEEKLARIGGKLLVKTLEQIETLTPQAQDESASTYAPLLKKEGAMIDWKQSARKIFKQIQAFKPWPVAFTLIDKQRLKIYSAEVLDDSSTPLEAGRISNLSDAGIEVACAFGRILIKEVQAEGKNRMKAGDYLKGSGRNLKIGQSLNL